MPSRNTRSAGATSVTKLRNRPVRRAIVKSENTPSESIHLPPQVNISDHETEEEQESEQDDPQDETFLPSKPSDVFISTGPKALRTPKAKPTSTRVFSIEIPQLPSSRSTRTKKRRGSSPSGPLDAANSSGSESKGNAGFISVSISRPHHRTTQPIAPAIPIPTRTFDPPLAVIEGYSGFYRRYPLILQFDTSGGAAEAGSPSKKGSSSFGDMEKFILDGVAKYGFVF